MSYMYRNRKSGEIITTSNKITGKNWIRIDEDIPDEESLFDDLFEDDAIDDAPLDAENLDAENLDEETAEEAPAPKPKVSRRSKK